MRVSTLVDGDRSLEGALTAEDSWVDPAGLEDEPNTGPATFNLRSPIVHAAASRYRKPAGDAHLTAWW